MTRRTIQRRSGSPPRGGPITLLLAGALFAAGAGFARADSAAATSLGAADSTATLAATSSVPWNPPHAIGSQEPWERALNAPLTLAALPLRAAGFAVHAGLLHVQQDNLVARVAYTLSVSSRFGISLNPAGLGDRTGFGAALRFEPPALRDWLRASLEGSTLHYSRGQVSVGPRALSAAYTDGWRPSQPFYGLGPDSRHGDVSSYATSIQRAEIRTEWKGGKTLRHDVSAWAGERRMVIRRGRDSSRPSYETVFPAVALSDRDVEQDHVVTGGRIALDTRAGHPHWSNGWRLAAETERYGAPRSGSGVLFPGDAASPGFLRTTLEGEAGLSFMRDPRTFRLAARVVKTHPFRWNERPSVADLVTLGGSAGLSGFEPGRFHGNDLALAKFTYLFPLAEHAELEAWVESGAVFGDVWNDARPDRLEQSYGVALRPRTKRAPLGSVNVNWSRESVRVGFSLGGVE